MSVLGGRDRVKVRLCGHCGTAARTKNPAEAHRRCPGQGCACADRQHRLDRTVAEVMVRTTRLPIDTVYAVHGRKRRVLTEDQREAAVARLAAARATRSLTAAPGRAHHDGPRNGDGRRMTTTAASPRSHLPERRPEWPETTPPAGHPPRILMDIPGFPWTSAQRRRRLCSPGTGIERFVRGTYGGAKAGTARTDPGPLDRRTISASGASLPCEK